MTFLLHISSSTIVPSEQMKRYPLMVCVKLFKLLYSIYSVILLWLLSTIEFFLWGRG